MFKSGVRCQEMSGIHVLKMVNLRIVETRLVEVSKTGEALSSLSLEASV